MVKRAEIIRFLSWAAYPLRVILAFVVAAFMVSFLTNLLIGSIRSPLITIGEGVAIYALTLLLLAGTEWLFERRWPTRRDFGLQALPTWAEVGYGLGGAVLYLLGSMALIAVATQFIPGFNADQAQDVGFRSIYGIDRLLAFGLLAVVAPVVEEAIFRGYLFTKLRSARMPVWLVVLVVSACFAAAHGQWNVALDVFVMSVVGCILRAVTGSIWPAIVIHMLKNSVAFYILFVVTQG